MGKWEVPEGFEQAEWDEFVRRGQRLIKQISDAKFALGDTLIEMLDNCGRGHGEVQEILTVYARQIRARIRTLEGYRYVASAWPDHERRPDVPWTVHKVLAPEPDRFMRIREEPTDPETGEQTAWTQDQALRVRDFEPQIPVTREEKIEHAATLLRDSEVAAETVGQLLERPEVASRVVGDQRSRRRIRQASAEHYRQMDEEAEAARELSAPAALEVPPDPDGRPQAPAVAHQETPAAVLRILGLCTSFSLSMRDAIFDVQGQDLAEEGKSAVRDSLEKVREVCGWCEDSVMSGRTGMDEALARMLGPEGGGAS